ncbi:MAG: type 1 glutamine amidotransferase [Nitrococcus sp.]|nr:type 1 glutamine amidotransferase [Nitrococcus sp.]
MITDTRFFESTRLPDLDDIDFLLILGGPMSANDEHEFPWLVQEKQFIRSAIETGKPALGVCLGAQLIASALGARVFPNHCKEIGWFPVHAVPIDDPVYFRFPALMEPFHWHGETFDLPAGAVRLAQSDACTNQAFQLGKHVIGLQFHLETTPQTARKLVDNCRAELSRAKYVQSETAILKAADEKCPPINDLMIEVLSFLRDSAIWTLAEGLHGG